jgi:hypothetical protein
MPNVEKYDQSMRKQAISSCGKAEENLMSSRVLKLKCSKNLVITKKNKHPISFLSV